MSGATPAVSPLHLSRVVVAHSLQLIHMKMIWIWKRETKLVYGRVTLRKTAAVGRRKGRVHGGCRGRTRRLSDRAGLQRGATPIGERRGGRGRSFDHLWVVRIDTCFGNLLLSVASVWFFLLKVK